MDWFASPRTALPPSPFLLQTQSHAPAPSLPSTFPLETEENIIDHLSDCVPALRHCALTCHAWLPRSRFHLLRSIRIKSGRQLEEFEDMLKTYPTRRSWITLVTMAPMAKESNPRRLIETFPATLFANTPNLRRWEISQADFQTVKTRAPLFFHNVTLTRLRYSSIQELHLSSVQPGSYKELIRLLMAFRRLECLKCTNLGFTQVSTDGTISSLKAAARRRLEKLSTLMVRDMKSATISLLLDVLQEALVKLHVFHIKGTKWNAIPLPKASTLPVLSKISSITIHWTKRPDQGLHEYLAGVFTSAAGLTADHHLRWASSLPSLGIELQLDGSVSQQHQIDTRSLAPTLELRDVLTSMKEQCLRLGQALADLRLKQYLVSLLLPSQWARNDNILKTCLGECFSVLHDKGMLTIVINGGEWNVRRDPCPGSHGDSDKLPDTSSSGMDVGHRKAVVAIVASPDAKWIASGSKDGSVVLWDAQHPGCIADQFQGFADSSRSLSFSPDSSRIVFPADDPTTAFHVRQLRAQGGSTLLSALRTTPTGQGLRSSRHCAWSRDSSTVSAVYFSRGCCHPVDAFVWDATTYALLHTLTDCPIPQAPLGNGGAVERNAYMPLVNVNCVLDGQRLVVAWLRDTFLTEWQDAVSSSPPSWSQACHALVPCRVWDVATGEFKAVEADEDPQTSHLFMFVFERGRRRLTTLCGDHMYSWNWTEWPPGYWMTSPAEGRTFPLSRNGRRRLSWSDSWSKVWDTHPRRCVSTFRCAHVVGGCFSPDGRHVAVCTETDGGGLVQVCMESTGVLLGNFRYECYDSRALNHRVVVFSGDEQAVYLGTSRGRVHVFSLPPSWLRPDAIHDGHTMRWDRCDEDSDI